MLIAEQAPPDADTARVCDFCGVAYQEDSLRRRGRKTRFCRVEHRREYDALIRRAGKLSVDTALAALRAAAGAQT